MYHGTYVVIFKVAAYDYFNYTFWNWINNHRVIRVVSGPTVRYI